MPVRKLLVLGDLTAAAAFFRQRLAPDEVPADVAGPQSRSGLIILTRYERGEEEEGT